MKRIILCLLLSLILIIGIVDAESLDYLSKEFVMDISLESSLKLIPELKSGSYLLDYVQTDMTLYPREDTRQLVLNLEIKPKPKKIGEAIEFLWDNPSENELFYRIDGQVKTLNNFVKVGKKIDFPIKDLRDSMQIYAIPSDNIDSDNEDIIKLASELAAGEDDLYVVVFNIAKWVRNNIEYTLDTLTAEVSQPSSWVLNSRYGVCDEITSLFIGLLRSVGIPARYISGVAYTNYNDANDWGAHAWAEVYFPDYGWVSFDITYDQFGSVDLSHIKLKESVDSNEPSTLFRWQGRNINIESEDLEIKAQLVDSSGTINDLIMLKAEIIKESVNFGSYNLIEATIENLHNYYLPINLRISKTKELEIMDSNNREILLKPFETKKVFWKLKVSDDLQSQYIYTFPVQIFTARNITSSTKFNSMIDEPLFSSDDIDEIIKQNQDEEEKTYSKNVDISCELDSDQFYIYEQGKADCTIKNTGNTLLENLNVCLKENCKTIDLGITQEKSLSFVIKEEQRGRKETDLTVKNSEVSKSFSLNYEALDEPLINIRSLDYPLNASYKDEFAIRFTLKKESYSIPVNVKVRLKQNSYEREWTSLELKQDEEYNIKLKGSDLSTGINQFSITVEYKDQNDREYMQQSNFLITLKNPKFTQKVMIWLNDLGKWLEGLF